MHTVAHRVKRIKSAACGLQRSGESAVDRPKRSGKGTISRAQMLNVQIIDIYTRCRYFSSSYAPAVNLRSSPRFKGAYCDIARQVNFACVYAHTLRALVDGGYDIVLCDGALYALGSNF